MYSLEVNGAHLSYIEAGQGDPVVFVHGSLEDLRIWRHQIEAFAERYHVLAYSRRYHHPNAGPSDDGPAYSATQHADDLAGLILKLHLSPAHLVTSSFGGCVALQMAVQHPELVRSMVLAEPPLMPWLLHIPGGAPHAADFMTHAWEPAQQAFRRDDFEQGVRLFHSSVMGRGAFDLLSPAGRRMIMDNAAEMRAETLADNYFPLFTSEDATRDRPAGASAERGAQPAPLPHDHRRAGALPAPGHESGHPTCPACGPRGESDGVQCNGARLSCAMVIRQADRRHGNAFYTLLI